MILESSVDRYYPHCNVFENMNFIVNRDLHPLSKQRYTANGTLVVAHGRFIFKTEPAFPTSMWVSCVTTPWNRSTIPRRCAPCMDAQVSQAQDVQERPLPCTPTSAPFTVFN